MKQNNIDSEELFGKELDNGQDSSSVPTDLTPFDIMISRSLVALAKSIRPDPNFRKALEEHLLTLQSTKQHVKPRSFLQAIFQFGLTWRAKMRTEKRFVYALGTVALLLIVTLWIIGPTMAQFALPHFAPHEVTRMPTMSAVTIADLPNPITTDIVGELEEQAGFAVLVPRYVPFGCQLHEGNYLPEPIGEVQLIYLSANDLPCFTTNQREVEDDTIHTPPIYEGSGEEITIHGQPALYIDGIWAVGEFSNSKDNEVDSGIIKLGPGELAELMETATWIEGPKQVVFEYGGFLLRLDGDLRLTKAELIKIAESME